MAKVSRAYIKSAGQDQSGSIQAGSTIYAQDILDLIDSAKWHDEGIENVYYDDTSHGIKVVKSSDPSNPVFIPVPKNSDIVNKLVQGDSTYDLYSNSGFVAKTSLPSTLVKSVKRIPDSNALKVYSTTDHEGVVVPLPDSLKSAAIEGNEITFTSLDGQKSVINLPDSLKSVAIEGNDITFTSLDGQQSVVNIPDSLKSVSIDGNTLTFTSVDGTPSVINLPATTGYLSDVSLEDGTLVFTKDGSSDVRVTLPFVSKAITGVSLQGSNLVFTFSDNTTANITLPTQSEEGTTAGLLSGVRIDGNKMIFTVSGGNDITIELPSTSGGSGDVDLTGLLFKPSYNLGRLSFNVKGSNVLASVDIPGVYRIDGLSGENLEYTDVKGQSNTVSLSNLTKGVLKGASVNGDNLVFTTKDSDNISVPLNDLIADGVLTGVSLVDGELVFTVRGKGNTNVPLDNLVASGVLTGVSLSNGNLVFTVRGKDNITIPLSSSTGGVTDVAVTNGELSVTKGSDTTKYTILPKYVDSQYISDNDHRNFGWGGSLGYTVPNSYNVYSYAPLWVPRDINYMGDVLKSQVYFSERPQITTSGTTYLKCAEIRNNKYVSDSGSYAAYYSISAPYCSLPFGESFSESSGTFTANVITNTQYNKDYVVIDTSIAFALNGNILEAFPAENVDTVVHLLKASGSVLNNFGGFAFYAGEYVILVDRLLFFAKKVFDWSYNATNSFGMKVYLGSNFEVSYGTVPFTATAGKVLD